MDGPFVLADATHVAPPLRTLCTPLFEAAAAPLLLGNGAEDGGAKASAVVHEQPFFSSIPCSKLLQGVGHATFLPGVDDLWFRQFTTQY